MVQEAIDKGAVGTIFQQPPHQVGQQVFMVAYRGIDPNLQLPVTNLFAQLGIENMAHSVKALELKFTIAGQFQDHTGGVGIVGGELGVDLLFCIQQDAGTVLVAEVGIGLAGIDRVTLQAQFLGVLYLRIPVGSLNQANHQPAVALPGQANQPFGGIRRPLLVGLQYKAEALPARQFGVFGQGFKNIQGDIQPIGFFGIDGEANIVLFSLFAELFNARQ